MSRKGLWVMTALISGKVCVDSYFYPFPGNVCPSSSSHLFYLLWFIRGHHYRALRVRFMYKPC